MRERLVRRGWLYYLIIGTVALAVMATTPILAVYDVIYLTISAGVVVAMLVGVRVHRPSPRAPWLVMALAQTFWVAADATYFVLVDIGHQDAFPSAADALYLAGYPLLLLGIALLIRSRPRRGGRSDLVDGSIVTVGLTMGFWALLAQPSLDDSYSSTLAAVVSVAYPMFDILLIGGLFMLMINDTTRAKALGLLLAACGMLIASDTLSIVSDAGAAVSPTLLDMLWVGSYVVWGAAVLHPSVGYRVRLRDASTGLSRKRLLAMALASLAPPLALVFEWVAGASLTVAPLALGSIVLYLLVLGRMVMLVRQVSQITLHSAELQQELEFRASHDDLTHLPNRAEMVSLIGAALERAAAHEDTVAVLFVDLDGFKRVNDTYGHRAGDRVLRAVADRLSRLAGSGSLAARLGGDEFVVLLPVVDSRDRAHVLADQIIEKVGEPIPLDGERTATVGASVGIAFSQPGVTTVETLLHDADLALYRAKELGRGRALPYSELLRREHDARADFERALRRAIDLDELVLHYQPILDVRNGVMRGAEALLRWNRPGAGLLMPGEFLPAAETSDLVCDLDVWVIKSVLRQLEAWADHPELSIAVNIAMRHILLPRVVVDLEEALAASSADPGRLVLEISEYALSGDGPVLRHLASLRELGVAISLSDFGAGIGSIGDLDRLPVDSVKIGRDLIQAGSPHMRAVLELMVGAARQVGVPVVGEGIERAEQLALLEEIDCHAAQGFLLGVPTTADKLMLPAAIPVVSDGRISTAS